MAAAPATLQRAADAANALASELNELVEQVQQNRAVIDRFNQLMPAQVQEELHRAVQAARRAAKMVAGALEVEFGDA